MNDTIVIQIGNSDDKLSQRVWADFCDRIQILANIIGQVHFSGGSASDAVWQNYCVVVSPETNQLEGGSLESFYLEIGKIAEAYGQESIAVTEGTTIFHAPVK